MALHTFERTENPALYLRADGKVQIIGTSRAVGRELRNRVSGPWRIVDVATRETRWARTLAEARLKGATWPQPAQPATVASVNRALRARGHSEKLTRGKGYYYFAGGDAMRWPTSSVMVDDVALLSVDDWMTERDLLALAGPR